MAHDTPSDLRELLPFALDGHRLRTLADPEPLFSAADICAMTGHSDPSRAVRDLLNADEWRTVDVSAGRADSERPGRMPGAFVPGRGGARPVGDLPSPV